MKQHALSAAYPAMSAEEFQTLKDSIESIGVQTPVTVYDGEIIDGWHRWTAAQQLGVSCPTVDLGAVDPVDFVRAANKARRHLSKSQYALIEVSLSEWQPSARPNKVAPGATLLTNAEMAAAAGVSPRMIRDAKTVEAKAALEVKEAVRAGTMSVKQAAATTKPAKPAAPAKAKRTLAPEAPSRADYEQDELRASVQTLAEDNERLSDRLAVKAMDATEDERTAAAATIAELRTENRNLTIELDATRSSRDTLLIESAALKRQCESLLRKLKKAEQAA